MALFPIFKGGKTLQSNHTLWVERFQPKGWSMEAPPVDEVEPVLDFTSYDQADLLHIAAITNVIVGVDDTRDDLEESLRLMWSASGKPPNWLEGARAADAPVAPEDIAIPPFNSDTPAETTEAETVTKEA